MNEEWILNISHSDEQMLRQWAFDEDCLLSEQDEDLLIGHLPYFPVLIPLASDPLCPKADYILACLDFYLMFVVLLGSETRLEEVHFAIELATKENCTKILEWTDLLGRRLKYRKGIGQVSKEQALLMGKDLLDGICRKSEITVSEKGERHWEVQLSVPPFHSHKEHLLIDKSTGLFTFRR